MKQTKLTDVSGVGPATAEVLAKHGIDTPEALADASLAKLVTVPGIGAERAASLKEAATRVLLRGTLDEKEAENDRSASKDERPGKTSDKRKRKKDKDKDKSRKKDKGKDKKGRKRGKNKKNKDKKGKKGK